MSFFTKKSKEQIKEEILQDYFISKGYKKNENFEEQDIFIAGFPKSGNTWMQHLMTGMIYGCNMSHVHNNMVRELVPDVHQFSYYKRYNERMAFKTHHLPRKEYKNVIYILRDGRDALTSFYKMEEGRSKKNSFENIVYKNQGLSASWSEHLNSWNANPFNAKVIKVRYEDLISDTFYELNKICKMFDIEVSKELLAEIIKNCSFGEMRKKEESVFWEKSKDWKESEFFVRKGQIGSYKSEMPPKLIKYFEENNFDLLKENNYSVTK